MGAPFLETPKYMSRKALKLEHLSLYRDSVRRTWKESSETHAIEGSGIGAFLLQRSISGT
jgi:hypothetical protein